MSGSDSTEGGSSFLPERIDRDHVGGIKSDRRRARQHDGRGTALRQAPSAESAAVKRAHVGMVGIAERTFGRAVRAREALLRTRDVAATISDASVLVAAIGDAISPRFSVGACRCVFGIISGTLFVFFV